MGKRTKVIGGATGFGGGLWLVAHLVWEAYANAEDPRMIGDVARFLADPPAFFVLAVLGVSLWGLWVYAYQTGQERDEARGRAAGLQSELDALKAAETLSPIVKVETFNRGRTGQLFVTNVTGKTDEFTAQIVGWSGKNDREPTESRVAWYLRWADHDGIKVRLHPDEKARIDLVEIEHDIDDSVDRDDPTYDFRNMFTLRVLGTKMWGSGDDRWSFQRYGDTKALDPKLYQFLVRFTCETASYSQTECFAVRVIGRGQDDPKRRVAGVGSRPMLWIDPCGEDGD